MNSIKKMVVAVVLTAVVGQAVALPGFQSVTDLAGAGYAFVPSLNVTSKAKAAGKHVATYKKTYGALATGVLAAAGVYGYKYGMPGFISTGANALVDNRATNAIVSGSKTAADFAIDNRMTNAVVSGYKALVGFAVDSRAADAVVTGSQAGFAHVLNHKGTYAAGAALTATGFAGKRYLKNSNTAPEVAPASDVSTDAPAVAPKKVAVQSANPYMDKSKAELLQLKKRATPAQMKLIAEALAAK